MNTIVFNKLSGAVLFEDHGAPERERGSRPYGGVLDSTHARPEVGIPDGPPLKDNLGLRHRRTGYAHLPETPARLQPGGVGAVRRRRASGTPGPWVRGPEFPGGRVSAPGLAYCPFKALVSQNIGESVHLDSSKEACWKLRTPGTAP